MVKKPHILLAIRTLSGAGAELVVENLCKGLNRARFEVTVCELYGTGEKAEKLRASGYSVVSLNPTGRKPSYLGFLRLAGLIRSHSIDLVHSHTTASLADAGLSRILAPDVKLIHTFHFGNYPDRELTHKRIERLFHRFANRLVAVGHHQADTIMQTYQIPSSRMVTIWNGIEKRRNRIDEALVGPLRGSGKILIGTIGTLIPQKGHQDLIEVAALMKERGFPVLFVIVGGGPLRQMLEDRVRELGLAETVVFLGWVRDAAETVLPAFDIFFQPSLWEAMSMVLLEAAAAGKPVVCTAVGEADRIVEHGRTGYLVPPRDVAGMIAALNALIADGALRERLGHAAAETVERCCRSEVMVERYEQLYLDVLGQSPFGT